MKKLLLSLILCLSTINSFASSDIGNILLGVVIGAQISQPQIVYQQPQIVYQQPQIVYQQPQIVYQQPQIVISPSQVQYYDPTLHGYCAGYQGYQYATCIDNIRRKKLDDFYRGYFR